MESPVKSARRSPRFQSEEKKRSSDNDENKDPENDKRSSKNDKKRTNEEKSKKEVKKMKGSDDDEAPSYELEREENIRRNKEMMERLGLLTAHSAFKAEVTPEKPKRTKSKPRPSDEIKPHKYGLRSKVTSETKLFVLHDHNVKDKRKRDSEPEEEPEPVWNDSKVFQYACEMEDEGREGKEEKEEEEVILDNDSNEEILDDVEPPRLKGFKIDKKHSTILSDSALKKIYAMDFQRRSKSTLMASGGHGGRISVYAIPSTIDEDQYDPLLSFKAHGGWISSVKFINFPAKKNFQGLLTSSNDGFVRLWNIAREDEISHKAEEIASTSSLHDGGIFSLDHSQERIITASKDGSVSYSSLSDASIDLVKTFNISDSVVKCCKFSSNSHRIFATAGNDMCIRVIDTRIKKPTLVIEHAHPHAINSISWKPNNDNIIMSAGFDPEIHLYDIRKSTKILRNFKGHNTKSSRSKNIYHPHFVENGSKIVSSGDRSSFVFLYDVEDGSMTSRGEINAVPTSILPDSEENTKYLAVASKSDIHLMLPYYS